MQRLFFYLKKAAEGLIITLCLLVLLFLLNKSTLLEEFLLSTALPNFKMNDSLVMLFNFGESPARSNPKEAYALEDEEENAALTFGGEVEGVKEETVVINSIETNEALNNQLDVVGINNVIFQPETDPAQIKNTFVKENITVSDLERLQDFNFLRSSFYIVDPSTDMLKADFNVDQFLSADLKIDNSPGKPKVLIFHTHSQEMFKDSDKSKITDGVYGVGEKLSQILSSKYNITSIHDNNTYDLVDGKIQIEGAYERMEPNIRKILKENPSIEIAIDMHRDGLSDETVKLVQTINGKPTAQLMFFNGLSKLYRKGNLEELTQLPNPYLSTNLAFSFNMQLVANKLFPDLTRKVYLRAYRYSLHMLPKTLFVEVGAQTNTLQECYNAMEPLADVLAEVILKK